MSYSHLFVLDPFIRAREDKDNKFDYYRDVITYILANDERFSDEYALFRAIAIKVDFNFDEYAESIVANASMEDILPKTSNEQLDLVKHLAVMILVWSDKCLTEDVIVFDAIARKYGFSLEVLDDVIQRVVSRISSVSYLKDSIMSSYLYAKSIDKSEFIKNYLIEDGENDNYNQLMF